MWLTAHGHDLDTVQWFEERDTGAVHARRHQDAFSMVRKRRPGGVHHPADRPVRHSWPLVAGVLFASADQHTRDRQTTGIATAKAKGIHRRRAQGTTKAKPRRATELKSQGLIAPDSAQVLHVSECIVRRSSK
jgi:hypothetical protein